MNKIKYNSDVISLINLFESMTGAKVKDCISNEKILFIMEENEMGKAIGKNGSNIKRIENALKKKVKLAEFSNDIAEFIRNMSYPAQITEIKQENGTIIIQGKDSNSKGMLIGRDRQSLNHLADIVKRYFEVKEIKVI